MSPDTLIVADLHQPFCREDYLDFCCDIRRKYNTKHTVFIGDLVDHHALSYHEHDPNGYSPGEEAMEAIGKLKPWFRAFPKADWCLGNHDRLPSRKAFTYGIPNLFIKPLREVYKAPRTWRVDFTFRYGNWLAQHGTNTSGDNGAFASMLQQGISIVQGHLHTSSGVKYHANEDRLIWAMQIGCGLDRRAYAFEYGKEMKRKPIVNCGVVMENGTLPIVEPMKL